MKTTIGILLFFSLIVLTHCDPGTAEGDRCDPTLSHDECSNAPTVQCVTPVDCPESYCCSPDSTAPNCLPGCNGGQASICAAGGDADCAELDEAGTD
jgi:hypothetical protein